MIQSVVIDMMYCIKSTCNNQADFMQKDSYLYTYVATSLITIVKIDIFTNSYYNILFCIRFISSAIVLNLASAFIAGIACAGLHYNIQN